MAEEREDIEITEGKGGKKKLIIIIVVALLLIGGGVAAFFMMSGGDEPEEEKAEVKQPPKKEVMKVIGHTKNAVQGRAALRKKYGVSDKEADDIIHKAMTTIIL